ncbi:MAG: ATP phosphoribosyltransferase regulatory subunit [Thermoanaerobaculia bacterium]
MRLSSTLPAGVSALFFESAARLRRLEALLAEELEARDFREAVLPMLDYFGPYEPLLAPAARAELYRFADRDGELLALRSDFTPMLARLLAPHLEGLELPLRLFYRGDVVRCPERGARSEVEQHQIGGELLGRAEDGTDLEREAARVCARLLALATSGRVRLVLGLAGALDELLVDAVGAERAPELARAIARRERGAARLPPGAAPEVSAAISEIIELGVPRDSLRLGVGGAAALVRLEGVRQELARQDPAVAATIDLAEFADFAGPSRENGARDFRPYYEGLVLRAYLPGRARPVASGGRYDALFKKLGAEVAAVGFSLQLDALAELPLWEARP